ncbi:MAG: RNA helicase [Candidatus Vogelbacteria bacterium CG22_combo_CG10-13_8_21_14_all_37_9]|uniref:RNA helicase n=1 Tax=Candidatus Vogelbacteria bacterium CG22_combo_CG10-13_8_21_14_all_37_9 TaxID=1975046 RepID=A0A2H0BKI4_9BACT|nr:MAG: hypothetical protein BK005_00515 [bacterium CG10_37_50]PIP58182.1 MAG: RNA helicase [Candidatus Vogelbacteria bacterium CG22_combo_CG10-13_8_21_14_all_37_9]
MFKRNYSRDSRSGKATFGRSSNSFHRRSGGRRSTFKSGPTISASRFISKADPIIKAKPYEAKHQFSDFVINDQLKKNIITKGYITPTPIQDQAIPQILTEKDVIGIANTGTGKTAAFLIPLLNKVLNNPKEKVLVIVPTRELASQINQELIDFRGALRIFSVCCFGGVSISQQISNLRRGHSFIIGTPGRLKDLVERRVINLASFGTIVLDEADRMLDMGFVADMRFVMSQMAPNRQTLLFSATINHELDKLIKEFLREPVTISVKTGETAKNVDQDVVRLRSGENKIEVLHKLLSQPHFSKVLIFGRTKHGVEKLSLDLTKRGFRAEAIHGNKNQSKRQQALRQFKDNRSQILVATDVAARGLDIPNVSHVINFDVPATYDDYVHRIGRTGRGDKTGQALTFID